MRAMVLNRYERPLEVEQLPERSPKPGETLIQVQAAALCASDIHAQHGGYARAGGRFPALLPPLILGHQIAGRVVARGWEDGEGGVPVGEPCVVFCYLYCGRCPRCLEGRQNLCERVAQRIGFEVPGGFAEYVTVPDANVFPAPAGLTPEQASVLPDAVATSYHAVVRRGEVRPQEAVVVFGVGALGLYAVRLAALRGARVVAVDRTEDERLELARRFGASETLAWTGGIAPGSGLTERIRALAGGAADVVLDLVGSTDSLTIAPEVVREGGRVVVVGVAGRGEVELSRYRSRRVELRTSLASTPGDLLDVLVLAERGLVEPIVAERVGLEDINEAMERLARGGIVGRVVAAP